jgi:hypothetical protein
MKIEELIASEGAHAEATRNDPPPADARATRRSGSGGASVLSVRISREQYQDLSTRAAAEGKPTSTLARELLLSALYPTEPSAEDAIVIKLEAALRRTLAPQLLAG